MRRLLPICFALAAVGPAAAPAGEPPAEPVTVFLAPAPPSRAAKERMRRWHRDTQGRISPLLREWRSLASTARQRPGQPLTAGCRRLDLALARLDRRGLPAAPDPSASLHLERALRSLSEASRSCAQGAWFLTAWRLRQADAAWRELRGRLRLYELGP